MIKRFLYIVTILFFLPCFVGADIFVDNASVSCNNGDTDYAPATRTCGAGSDTIYTSWSNAVTGVSAGSQGTPTVVNIRSGTTYTMSDRVTINKAWTTWRKYPSDVSNPVFDWNWAWTDDWKWSGMVLLSANGITVDGVSLTRLGYDSGNSADLADAIQSGQAVENGTGYDYITVQNCQISYVGHSGVFVRNASNVLIDNNTFYEVEYSRSELGGFSWAAAIDIGFGTTDAVVSNNTITNCGGEGIQATRDITNLTVNNNVLCNIARPGIYLMHTQNADVYGNLIYHTGASRFDSYHCGIMISGEGFRWLYQDHHFQDASNIDVYQNMVVNTIRPLGIGVVDTDLGYVVSDVRFYNNTIVQYLDHSAFVGHAGSGVGTGVYVRNNFFYIDPSSAASNIVQYINNVNFTGNLFSEAPLGGAQSSSDPTYPNYQQIDLSLYLTGSNFSSLSVDSLSTADFVPRSSAAYLIDTGTADATYNSLIGVFSGTAPDQGAVEYGQQPIDYPPNGTIDNPVSTVNITTGGSVSFSGTGSDPDNDTPLTYYWNFGNGQTSTSEDPGSITYNVAGTYYVTFTVTDANGNPDPTPASVTINVSDEGETCTQGAYAVNDLCADEDHALMLSNSYATGFSFTANGNETDWGIQIRIKSYAISLGGDVYLRLGTSADLSSYVAKATITVETANEWISPDIQFTDSNGDPYCLSQTDTTVYYVGLINADADRYIYIKGNASSGTCSNSQKYVASSNWDMSGGGDSGDFWFRIIRGNASTPPTPNFINIVPLINNGTYKTGELIPVRGVWDANCNLSDGGNTVVDSYLVTNATGTALNLYPDIGDYDANATTLDFTGTISAGSTASDLTISSFAVGGDDSFDCSTTLPSGSNLGDNADIAIDTSTDSIASTCAVKPNDDTWTCITENLTIRRDQRSRQKVCWDGAGGSGNYFADGLLANIATAYNIDAGSALVYQPTGWGIGTNCFGMESQKVEWNMQESSVPEASTVNSMQLDYVSGTTSIRDQAGNVADTELPQVALDPTYNVIIDGTTIPSGGGDQTFLYSSDGMSISSQ